MGEEIVQLRAEIDRIATSTEFNTQKLLTGALAGVVDVSSLIATGEVNSQMGGLAASNLTIGGTIVAGVTVTAATVPPTMAAGAYTFTVSGATIELRQGGAGGTIIGTATAFGGGPSIGNGASDTLTFTNGYQLTLANTTGGAYAFATLATNVVAPTKNNIVVETATVSGIDVVRAHPQAYTLTSTAAGTITATGVDGTTQTITGIAPLAANEVRTLQFEQLALSITAQAGSTGMSAANFISSFTAAGNNSLTVAGSGNVATLQVGANVPDTLILTFTDLQSAQLGSGAYKLGGPAGLAIDPAAVVKDITESHKLMAAIDGAIQVVNSQRGSLGAAQNRLEHSINSLGVAVENLGASESRIRDADIASLSSELVSAQILQQAGVSVLSQANQAPQAILQLLQGR
jgi:flagellin